MPAPSSATEISTSVAADQGGGEHEGGARRFAGGFLRAALFDAVVDRVAEKMNERVLHLLEDAFVDFDFTAANHEIDGFSLLAAEVADEFREQVRERGERKHDELLRIEQQVVDAAEDVVAILRGGFGHGPHALFEGAEAGGVPLEKFGDRGVRAVGLAA